MKKCFLFLVVIVMFIAKSTNLKAQVNIQDSLALIDLYESAFGDNTSIKWLKKNPVSIWDGITVKNGRVTSIMINIWSNYQFNYFNGSIPSSIGNITNLDKLDLSNSYLSGFIPSSLGNLKNLTYLKLSNNSFKGFIPSSIGYLNKLTYLDLYSNSFSESIPSSLGNLKNLTYLDLSLNQLSGSIPSSLGNLTNLETFNLNQNKLTDSIPSTIGNLTKLTQLNLYSNNLSGSIPSSLSNLNKLVGFYLNSNNLSGAIPSSLSNLINLQYLKLQDNQLSDSIPFSLGKLINLISLDLHDNQLSGSIPSSLGDLSSLGALWLNNNHLSGNIPSSFGNLNNLSSLYLNNNQLSGTIPYTLSHLKTISFLSLNDNQFTFNGMESIIYLAFGGNTYAPQSNIPLKYNGNILSVSVGGTPKNDTYQWYLNGNLVVTNTLDSTFTPISNGQYWVVVTNELAKQLTLYSEKITISDLPITLSSFSVTVLNKTLQINWQTASELNTSLFIIEHSTNGSSFTELGTVKAIGNGANSYTYTDENPLNAINYYRLKSVDNDGSVSYSKVVSCVWLLDSKQLAVYPNPAKSSVSLIGNHITSVQMIDNMGRVVMVLKLKDATNPKLSIGSLHTGVYHLRVKTTDSKVNSVDMLKE